MTLKLKTIHKCSLSLGRSPCYASLRGVRAHENVEHSQRRENVIYRDRSRIIELLLQLENKQQIIQNNVETQHNRMYSFYIGSCVM